SPALVQLESTAREVHHSREVFRPAQPRPCQVLVLRVCWRVCLDAAGPRTAALAYRASSTLVRGPSRRRDRALCLAPGRTAPEQPHESPQALPGDPVARTAGVAHPTQRIL